MMFGLLFVASCQKSHAAIRFRAASADFITSKSSAIANRAFNFTNKITIALWLQYASTDGGGTQILVNKGRSDFGGQNHFDLKSIADKFVFTYAAPDATYITWTTTATHVQTVTPMHLAVAFEYGNGGSMGMFVNGLPVAGSFTAGTGNQAALTNALPFHVAAGSSAGNIGNFLGDELCIWNTVLSTNQINRLASSRMRGFPRLISPESIAMYLPLDTQPVIESVPGANNFNNDFSRFNCQTDAGGIPNAGRWLSYQPNE
jgi:hypothetical protein